MSKAMKFLFKLLLIALGFFVVNDLSLDLFGILCRAVLGCGLA